ncbi:MAG: hypothetical protein LBS90_00690 [Oscillospiraceae bacterium]|jgi:penicillin-binding protein 2|nr:hypothetical protein [Oscillospiraceae bacterium]
MMYKIYQKTRLAAVLLFTAAVLTVYVAALYQLQIYNAELPADAAAMPLSTSVVTQTLRAKRGDILDRNGKLLITSRPSYDITLARSVLVGAGGYNEVVRDVIHRTLEAGADYADTFPVTGAAPFEFLLNMTATQRKRLDAYIEYFGLYRKLGDDFDASDLVVWMKEHYKIPYTMGIADTRLIIGVRYELEVRLLVPAADYVFAADIPQSLAVELRELAYPGVEVVQNSKREYRTTLAAHILGYTGPMTAAELAVYREFGYPMDAVVGKTGAEAAFEAYLHGVDGKRVVRVAPGGAVVAVLSETPPVPGQNVYLSIDIDTQETAERALDALIAEINLSRPEDAQKITGGAVTAINIRTGEVIVEASYPTFDPATVIANYAELNADPLSPLYNRAAYGNYNPGSTFKPVTAYAGLSQGVISRYTTVFDSGKFEKYADVGFAPRCWIFNQVGYGHGNEDVVTALRDSCNVFFYTVADMVGYRGMITAAREFGFGEKTGVELGESAGVVGTEEFKRSHGLGNWVSADTVYAGIGQGYSYYTPLQLANYVSTIAAGGTRYKASLLREVKSADYTATVAEHTPSVAATVSHPEYIQYLQEGMRLVVTSGTAKNAFAGFPIKVAAKTGTTQSSTSDIDNGVFICYAPSDNPEIAIAVVVEKGGSGASIVNVAKTVLTKYFEKDLKFSAVGEGTLVP